MKTQNLGRAARLAVVALFACLFAAGVTSRSGARQQPSPDAPVEQTRKNIQVLKGLPESQLFHLMNFVSASMGVRCDYCHVIAGKNAEGQNNWVWESDDKPQKVAARRMMRMTMQLNQTNLADFHNQKITCYTCHRGSTDPARMPSLPLAQSGHEPGPSGPADASRQSPTPTAEEVLAKYVAAVGGREAINGMRSVVMRGTREASQGRVWPVEVTLAGADRYAVVASIPAQGQQPAFEIRQAYSGGKGWIKTPRGVREFTPAELSDIRGGIALVSPLKIAQPFPRMTFGGVRQVGDRDAYVLVERREPDTTVRYFFDRETGLLVRELRLRETVLNALPEQVDYEDYRDVGGVKLPFKITISAIDTYDSSTRKFTDIRTNVPVDDAIFQMPAAPPKP
ncbi:MAG TPA: c-type cytochrome [Pyrinomonadaceae bacterium]